MTSLAPASNELSAISVNVAEPFNQIEERLPWSQRIKQWIAQHPLPATLILLGTSAATLIIIFPCLKYFEDSKDMHYPSNGLSSSTSGNFTSSATVFKNSMSQDTLTTTPNPIN